MKNRLMILLIPIVTACATPYAPHSFSGGFSDTQLSDNVYRVTFQGNGFTDADRTSDFALLRSAELTLRGGYRYFAIGDTADRSESLMFKTPTTTTASAYASGNTFYGTATTTGGALIPIIKPGVALTIFCSCDRSDPRFFDAAFLAQSLTTKYRLESVQTHAVISRCPTESPVTKATFSEVRTAEPTSVESSDAALRHDIQALGESSRYPFVSRLSEPMLTLLKSGRAKTTAHAYLLACETNTECAVYHGLK